MKKFQFLTHHLRAFNRNIFRWLVIHLKPQQAINYLQLNNIAYGGTSKLPELSTNKSDSRNISKFSEIPVNKSDSDKESNKYIEGKKKITESSATVTQNRPTVVSRKVEWRQAEPYNENDFEEFLLMSAFAIIAAILFRLALSALLSKYPWLIFRTKAEYHLGLYYGFCADCMDPTALIAGLVFSTHLYTDGLPELINIISAARESFSIQAAQVQTVEQFTAFQDALRQLLATHNATLFSEKARQVAAGFAALDSVSLYEYFSSNPPEISDKVQELAKAYAVDIKNVPHYVNTQRVVDYLTVLESALLEFQALQNGIVFPDDARQVAALFATADDVSSLNYFSNSAEELFNKVQQLAKEYVAVNEALPLNEVFEQSPRFIREVKLAKDVAFKIAKTASDLKAATELNQNLEIISKYIAKCYDFNAWREYFEATESFRYLMKTYFPPK